MNVDIDTAAIRGVYAPDPMNTPAVYDMERMILALCDALDAARAQRDTLAEAVSRCFEDHTGDSA